MFKAIKWMTGSIMNDANQHILHNEGIFITYITFLTFDDTIEI